MILDVSVSLVQALIRDAVFTVNTRVAGHVRPPLAPRGAAGGCPSQALPIRCDDETTRRLPFGVRPPTVTTHFSSTLARMTSRPSAASAIPITVAGNDR